MLLSYLSTSSECKVKSPTMNQIILFMTVKVRHISKADMKPDLKWVKNEQTDDETRNNLDHMPHASPGVSWKYRSHDLNESAFVNDTKYRDCLVPLTRKNQLIKGRKKGFFYVRSTWREMRIWAPSRFFFCYPKSIQSQKFQKDHYAEN